jgi:hypothetical protein
MPVSRRSPEAATQKTTRALPKSNEAAVPALLSSTQLHMSTC